jgi:two-component system phosphate regulon response regulator OmpR
LQHTCKEAPGDSSAGTAVELFESARAREPERALSYTPGVTTRILLIEDDVRLAAMVSEYLGAAGFRATIAPSGAAGLDLLKREPFDALLLDLMLPDMDGLEVCRRVRSEQSNGAELPIVMLTARGDAADRIVGLELGADDYLPKPFEPRELLARLRAILRRSKGGEEKSELMRFGRLEIDVGARQVRLDNEVRALTGYQFGLLLVLARHAGRVMSREAIMDAMKNERLDAFDRSIDVHISRIRAAIEDDPKKPRRVITVRGAGYVFAKAQD